MRASGVTRLYTAKSVQSLKKKLGITLTQHIRRNERRHEGATGEFSLHHVRLTHGSAPNTTDDRRIGFAIRYIPPHVRQLKVRDSAMLVRGVDRHGHYDWEPEPAAELDAAAVAAHADAVGRQVAALYQGTEKTAFRV